jgi:hypothetical protein
MDKSKEILTKLLEEYMEAVKYPDAIDAEGMAYFLVIRGIVSGESWPNV